MKLRLILIFALISMVFLPLKAFSADMRRPLSTQQPMYIFHIDVWNNADPQKIIDLIPEDMLPYTVFNISLSVTESVTKDGFRTAESWLRTCAENRVWALIQPASGGHAWFSDYDTSVHRYFFENYPNFLGFNYCEQFWGFDDASGLHPFGLKSPTISDRMNLFVDLLDLADEFGGYLVVSNCLVIPEWDSTSPLTMFKRYPAFAEAAKKHKEHLVYCEKYTTSANFYDMESMCLGVFLSDHCDNWGMRFDQCGYTEHVYNNMAGEQKMPPAIGGMTILEHMMMTGQTVQDGPELITNQCVRALSDVKTDDGYNSRRFELFPQFPNVYMDIWRKFTTEGVIRILPRQEVIDSTKIAVYNDIDQKQTTNNWEGRRSHRYLFSGLYALDNGTFGNDTVYLKKTGRYTTIPTIFVDNGEELGFKRVVRQSRYYNEWTTNEAKIDEFNALFLPQTGDDPETSLYVRRIDNNWLVYNNSQYEKQRKVETSTIGLRYNSCDAVTLTMPMYSFGLLTEKEDGIDIYLNNYTHFKGQTNDTIVIKGCTSQPTFEVMERGDYDASKHDKPIVTSSYADGNLTLVVAHNGPLDINVKCQGSNSGRMQVPVWERTFGCEIPPVYKGTRQWEWENADYAAIDKAWNGAGRSDIPGFTALGYVSYGTANGAKLRDNIRIDEAGRYKMTIRYLAPEEEVNRVNITVNGKVVARNVKFPKTDDSNTWAESSVEFDLPEGVSELILSSTKVQTTNLYLDNFTLTPLDPDAVESVHESNADNACYDIFGRRVKVENLSKGQIYIQNGKKHIAH